GRSVSGVTHHLYLGVGVEESGEPLPDHCLIVADEDPDHCSTGRLASTTKRPSARPRALTLPPTAVARSAMPVSAWPGGLGGAGQGVATTSSTAVSPSSTHPSTSSPGAWRVALDSASWRI